MKKTLLLLALLVTCFVSNATTHIVHVWEGYYQFVSEVDFSSSLTIQLGDTVQWQPLPNEQQMMVHTITSTSIPAGAATFDYTYEMPSDTLFRYVPQLVGVYDYECTPHIDFNMVGSITVEDGSTDVLEANKPYLKNYAYPNPCKDILQVRNSSFKEICNIYSSSGTLVFQGMTNSEMDVSGLDPGYYIIEIIGDRPRMINFIKQ